MVAPVRGVGDQGHDRVIEERIAERILRVLEFDQRVGGLLVEPSMRIAQELVDTPVGVARDGRWASVKGGNGNLVRHRVMNGGALGTRGTEPLERDRLGGGTPPQ